MADAHLPLRVLKDRLADTQLPSDPTRVVLPPGSGAWPASFRDDLVRSLKPAGVLIPVIEREPGASVLLTLRARGLRHHAGQVSFPGGRMEARDRDIRATALRETHEEVGIEPGDVDVVGYLEPMPTMTGFAVTAVIGVVPENVDPVIDRGEVDAAFEVPLEFLLEPRNRRYTMREVRGRRIRVAEFHHAGHRIWGATAQMIIKLG